SYTIPVEYPKVGEAPSPAYLSVVTIANGHITKIAIPGDPAQHYLPRMDWAAGSDEPTFEQLDRKQQESNIYLANAANGTCTLIYNETDSAWIDSKARWNHDDPTGWTWINNGKAFIWVSEKDGWRHIYRIDRNGNEKRITSGDYDIMGIDCIDEKAGYVYFSASPDNATQKYLYRVKLNGGKAERLTPEDETGTHHYTISPNGKLALHRHSSHLANHIGHVVRSEEHTSELQSR